MATPRGSYSLTTRGPSRCWCAHRSRERVVQRSPVELPRSRSAIVAVERALAAGVRSIRTFPVLGRRRRASDPLREWGGVEQARVRGKARRERKGLCERAQSEGRGCRAVWAEGDSRWRGSDEAPARAAHLRQLPSQALVEGRGDTDWRGGRETGERDELVRGLGVHVGRERDRRAATHGSTCENLSDAPETLFMETRGFAPIGYSTNANVCLASPVACERTKRQRRASTVLKCCSFQGREMGGACHRQDPRGRGLDRYSSTKRLSDQVRTAAQYVERAPAASSRTQHAGKHADQR
jgi:hypothetical protein